ncbi:MAG: rhomboid family intramembrane serine protease, partial [Bacteroidota bacterium]
ARCSIRLLLAFNLFGIIARSMRAIVWILLLVFAGFSLLMGFTGEVDNAAHLGGLAAGTLVGSLWALLNGHYLKRNHERE